MRRRLTPLAAAAVTLVLVVGPLVYALNLRAQTRAFRVVRPGVLYRSGQMSLAGLQRVAHDHRIRTVVSLRDADRPADLAEEAFCNKEEIAFLRLPPLSWDKADDGTAPVDANIARFLALVDKAENQPILVHCFAGVHRTGAYVAIYRMEKEGWSNEQAIAEMRRCGYDTLDGDHDIRTYLETYRPRRNR